MAVMGRRRRRRKGLRGSPSGAQRVGAGTGLRWPPSWGTLLAQPPDKPCVPLQLGAPALP